MLMFFSFTCYKTFQTIISRLLRAVNQKMIHQKVGPPRVVLVRSYPLNSRLTDWYRTPSILVCFIYNNDIFRTLRTFIVSDILIVEKI
jgi:hypothetical protein